MSASSPVEAHAEPQSKSDPQLVKLSAKPTLGHAFQAWLAYSGTRLTPDEYRSAKNFARAYQLWFRKLFGAKALNDEVIHAESLVTHIHDFVDEVGLSQDPISERLSPMSKTTYIGTNTRRFIKFLNEQGALSRDETHALLRQCTTMDDDLKRCQRVKWLMTQQELFFEPRLGGRHRQIAFQGEKVTGNTYEVVDIGENYVLANTCDERGQLLHSPDNPLKIQVPRSAASLLKPGDGLQIDIRKVATSDYWIAVLFGGIMPKTAGLEEHPSLPSPTSAETPAVQALGSEIDKFLTLTKSTDKKSHGKSHVDPRPHSQPKSQSSHEEDLVHLRSDKEYQKRREERLLGGGLPDEGFPDAIYNETWFRARETDLASDEEVGEMWDDDEGDDDFDGDNGGD
ncbi:hypothetical protein PILCRDRAFT_817087 [Piloderma croceum F 1598]|uniref:Uncharacterized protein n=1 Tax=Piloderma croceum (strain F 1598) TaxID=765440 RepID=A0A0C3G5C3_PILCF|nr:hypothetical protein PILCRDRAFT_817087 [Piloderma croceum F 1598]